ncbi:N-acetylmuramoyl-L-alanine amidase [Sporomusaceae bacterium FL31]|nr:N-acetylmuramoyl-L-alanine amidase [Sporomusaceae bacterium FL31]GCE33676.1 N-acetylmuramoyl-L-alanine amidase [Sporomusaceae bacterium]
MRVTINGGHYPNLDSGAIGKTGLQEAVITKDVMQRVAAYLKVIAYEVLEVQKNELYEITSASNSFHADVFISIHCNAAGNDLAKGAETWYQDNSLKGEKLANCIQKQIVNSITYNDGKNIVDRGIKAAVPGISGLYVLNQTNCPAVLVELAFITNSEDEKLLAESSKRDEFARAIARGITDYWL